MTAIRHSPGLRNITVAWHETLIGRARGRALAHEVGHYLLRSKLHTLRGLMRAVLSGDEFLALIRDGFELTPDQSLAAAHANGIPASDSRVAISTRHVRETIDRVHSIRTNDCSLSRILPDATHRYHASIVGSLRDVEMTMRVAPNRESSIGDIGILPTALVI